MEPIDDFSIDTIDPLCVFDMLIKSLLTTSIAH